MGVKKKSPLKPILVIVVVIVSVVSLSALMALNKKGTTGKSQKTTETSSAVYNKKETAALQSQLRQTLQDKITAYLQENEIESDQIGIFIEGFKNGVTFEENPDQYFTAASTYKLSLAMVYYDQIAAGQRQLTDTLVYGSDYAEDDGPVAWDHEHGEELPLSLLLNSLIVYSDNSAANILWEGLGGWESYKQLDAEYSSVPLTEEFYSDANLLTPRYGHDLLTRLYHDPEKYGDLLRDLKQAEPGNYLRITVNEEIAQKYGAFDDANNILGIVYGKQPYSIAIYTQLNSWGTTVISDLNKIVYDTFNEYPDLSV